MASEYICELARKHPDAFEKVAKCRDDLREVFRENGASEDSD